MTDETGLHAGGLTNEQLKAVRALERVMRKLADANISLMVMEGTMSAFDSEKLTEAGRTHGDSSLAMQSLDSGYVVESHGVHMDGGGW